MATPGQSETDESEDEDGEAAGTPRQESQPGVAIPATSREDLNWSREERDVRQQHCQPAQREGSASSAGSEGESGDMAAQRVQHVHHHHYYNAPVYQQQYGDISICSINALIIISSLYGGKMAANMGRHKMVSWYSENRVTDVRDSHVEDIGGSGSKSYANRTWPGRLSREAVPKRTRSSPNPNLRRNSNMRQSRTRIPSVREVSEPTQCEDEVFTSEDERSRTVPKTTDTYPPEIEECDEHSPDTESVTLQETVPKSQFPSLHARGTEGAGYSGGVSSQTATMSTMVQDFIAETESERDWIFKKKLDDMYNAEVSRIPTDMLATHNQFSGILNDIWASLRVRFLARVAQTRPASNRNMEKIDKQLLDMCYGIITEELDRRPEAEALRQYIPECPKIMELSGRFKEAGCTLHTIISSYLSAILLSDRGGSSAAKDIKECVSRVAGMVHLMAKEKSLAKHALVAIRPLMIEMADLIASVGGCTREERVKMKASCLYLIAMCHSIPSEEGKCAELCMQAVAFMKTELGERAESEKIYATCLCYAAIAYARSGEKNNAAKLRGQALKALSKVDWSSGHGYEGFTKEQLESLLRKET